MANTYTLINSITVGSGGAANMTFSSIPQTYTDLQLFVTARIPDATYGTDIYLAFNGSSSSQTGKRIYGYSGTAYSDTTAAAGFTNGSNATSNTFTSNSIYVPNYTSSNNKSWSVDLVTENNSTTAYLPGLFCGLWSNTAAITSIAITAFGGSSFVQYSTAYLYGIKNS